MSVGAKSLAPIFSVHRTLHQSSFAHLLQGPTRTFGQSHTKFQGIRFAQGRTFLINRQTADMLHYLSLIHI